MGATFNVHEAKTHLSQLLERAAAGEEIVIARANKPIAKLVAITLRPKKRVAGLNAGRITYVADDFDAPLPDEFWEGRPDDSLNVWIREQQARARTPEKRGRKPSRPRARKAPKRR